VADRGDEGRATPSHAELERAIASVPGVVEAVVATGEGATRSRLRIRLAPQEDAEAVAWAVAATLRERFGIALDPDDIRPPAGAEDEAPPDAGTPASAPTDVADEGLGEAPALSDEELREARERLTRAAREAAEGTAGRRPGPDPLDILWGRQAEEAAAAGPPPAPSGSGSPPTAETTDVSHNGAGGVEVRPAEGTSAPAPAGETSAPAAAEVALEFEAAVGAGGDTEGPAAPTAGEQPTEPPATEQPATPPVAEEPATEQPAPRSREPRWGARPGPGGADDRLPRAVIRNLDTQLDRQDVRVTATLEHAGRSALGEALSVATGHGVLRAVAEATVAALRGLSSERLIAGIDRIVLDPAHDPATAMVVLTLVSERGEERLVGSSIVRSDPERAVMRATLDALNRRVASYLLDDVAAAGA
jgi:hypothetical protein